MCMFIVVYFNKHMKEFDAMFSEMESAASDAKFGQVSDAVRDVEMNGVAVKKGQFISIMGKEIISADKELFNSTKVLIEKIVEAGSEILTIYLSCEGGQWGAMLVEV